MAPAACACGTSTRTPRFVHAPHKRASTVLINFLWAMTADAVCSHGRGYGQGSQQPQLGAFGQEDYLRRRHRLCLRLRHLRGTHPTLSALSVMCARLSCYVRAASGQLLTRALRTDCFAQRPGVGQAGVQPEGPRLLVGSDPRTRIRRRRLHLNATPRPPPPLLPLPYPNAHQSNHEVNNVPVHAGSVCCVRPQGPTTATSPNGSLSPSGASATKKAIPITR